MPPALLGCSCNCTKGQNMFFFSSSSALKLWWGSSKIQHACRKLVRILPSPLCLSIPPLTSHSPPGAVFSGYYQSSPPGVYFSMQVFLSLLWALLKAGMVSDIFSILRVTLAHNIVVSLMFVLVNFSCLLLFRHVRNRFPSVEVKRWIPEL